MNTPHDSAAGPVSRRVGGPVPDGYEPTAVTAGHVRLVAFPALWLSEAAGASSRRLRPGTSLSWLEGEHS